jgi:hypothetical protein
MSTRVVDRVDEWDERPFDGYRSLHEFADEGFSGAVRAGGAELYMTKGTVVGIRHGSIDDFESGGTAYQAPSPALPLLAIMQETNDEVRAEYYSEKTSIAEVDSTLSNRGFTGYIELSDNVLSGDYYQVYHAGQAMSVGFVGTSSRLIDGDEAFETANDEVGIYQVRPADIEVIELPEVETTPDTVAGAGETAEDDEVVTETAETDDETDTDADAAESEAVAAEQSDAEVDLETRAIPSLDPEQTADPGENGGNARADTFQRTQEQRSPAAGTAQAATRVDQQSTQGTAQTTERTNTAAADTQPQENNRGESTEQTTSNAIKSPTGEQERVSEANTSTQTRTSEPMEISVDEIDIEYQDLDIKDCIGAGGFAVVYEALLSRDKNLRLALKKPQISGTLEKETVNSFATEAETWESVSERRHVVDVIAGG